MNERPPASEPSGDIPRPLERLPHRYPFVLIDRVTHVEKGVRVEGYKNVAHNEPFFQGHFPGNPIMPAVLQIEAMAQLGGWLYEPEPGRLMYLAGVDGARFRRPVVPGDRLEVRVELVARHDRLWKVKGRCEVEGKKVSEAEILLAFAPVVRPGGAGSV